jgi:hypothetical protein
LAGDHSTIRLEIVQPGHDIIFVLPIDALAYFLILRDVDLTMEDVKTDEPRRIYFDSVSELKRVLVQAARIRRPDQSIDTPPISYYHNFLFDVSTKPSGCIKNAVFQKKKLAEPHE